MDKTEIKRSDQLPLAWHRSQELSEGEEEAEVLVMVVEQEDKEQSQAVLLQLLWCCRQGWMHSIAQLQW